MTCCAVAALTLLACGSLHAQSGTTPKHNEQDYPVHTQLGTLGIGAEYLTHSFSEGNEMYIAKDYLVIEVAFFPAKGEKIDLAPAQFTLRINKGKSSIEPQAPEFVASSLQYSDPETRRGVQAGVGPVIFGSPQSTGRFPGDPTTPHPYPVPRAPDDNPTGNDKEPAARPEEIVLRTALPEGEHHGPVSGYLYFPFKGKIKHLRELDLEFSNPAGSVTLKLLQP